MSKLCTVNFVGGWYRHYIPLYLFCLFQAYKYDAVIFLDEPPDKKMERGIEIAQRTGGRSKLIYDKRLRDYPKADNKHRQGEIYSGQRLLVFNSEYAESVFSKYEYVYLTDIDILIMPERPSLLEQHIQHCKVLGLPYSNFVRLDTKRLTGLHFMRSKDYFPAVSPVVDKYTKLMRERGIHAIMGSRKTPAERLLYRMVKESGLGLPPEIGCSATGKALRSDSYKRVCFGPHHGVHIGMGRCMKRFRGLVNEPPHLHYVAQLVNLAKRDSRFGELYNHLDHRGKAALKAILKETRLSV